LIENSVKYAGDQEFPEMDIGSRMDGEETVFFVKDNGIGIDLKSKRRSSASSTRLTERARNRRGSGHSEKDN
jgi:light-regulated signal transduction histidine kinase (bacteriophytochrome)